jgi:hypothetical protein
MENNNLWDDPSEKLLSVSFELGEEAMNRISARVLETVPTSAGKSQPLLIPLAILVFFTVLLCIILFPQVHEGLHAPWVDYLTGSIQYLLTAFVMLFFFIISKMMTANYTIPFKNKVI